MARTDSTELLPHDGTIVDIDVAEEMESSFLEYAYSVIYSRALPDARDGLKPVQRRILYMMDEMGLKPEKGHVKSARVVGEVMGKLHPHGDGAIYDAMVRMAQSFSLRLPLVDGHGNFGSLDDGPAASRYTEARMAAAALTLTANLDEDVVDFEPNYDGQIMQPSVLPAAFPNLLVNGASGIAVGMATNMAPHNLGEVIGAAVMLINEPEASLEQVLKVLPGPDLPSGGVIVGLDGIHDAYRTGRGTFKTRAKVELENLGPRKTGLVVTELPFGVGPEKVIEKIKDGVQNKKLTGISNVIDLSDRKNGLRLVIELKNGFNPNAILASLYRYTPMEDSFGINNVCLVDGQPQTLGLLDLLRVYIGHRVEVVRRRSVFRLGKKKDRLHLVLGLLLALVDIDEVIEIIRTSDDTAAAKTRLMQVFDLTEIQAEYILELRLRQLTKFSRIDLETERGELEQQIAELEEILSSETNIKAVICSELEALKAEHATARRTVLKKSAEEKPLKGTSMPVAAAEGKGEKAGKAATAPLRIADDPCYVVLTATGLLGRTVDRAELEADGARAKHDAVRSVLATTARAEIGIVTSAGRMFRMPVMDMTVFETGARNQPNLSTGIAASEYHKLEKGEKVIAAVSLTEVFALGTAQGVVKRVTPDYPLSQDEWICIALKPKDTVLAAQPAGDEDELVFLTRNAQLLRLKALQVRPQGRNAGGMAGIKLGADDAAIAFAAISPAASAAVVTVTSPDSALPGLSSGSVKLTSLEEFPVKGRATGGVRAHRLLKGEADLALGFVGPVPVRASSAAGVARALPSEYGQRDGSGIPLESAIGLIGSTAGAVVGAQASAFGASAVSEDPAEEKAVSAAPAAVSEAEESSLF